MTKERVTKTTLSPSVPSFRQPRYDLVFNTSGVAQSGTFGPWRPRDHSTIFGVRVDALTAPGSNCTFTLQINGHGFLTVTLAGGSQHVRGVCYQPFTTSDIGTLTVAADGVAAGVSCVWEYGIP